MNRLEHYKADFEVNNGIQDLFLSRISLDEWGYLKWLDLFKELRKTKSDLKVEFPLHINRNLISRFGTSLNIRFAEACYILQQGNGLYFFPFIRQLNSNKIAYHLPAFVVNFTQEDLRPNALWDILQVKAEPKDWSESPDSTLIRTNFEGREVMIELGKKIKLPE